MGMIEASGIGWQGRYEQAELIAEYLSALAARARARGAVPASGDRRAVARSHRRLPLPRTRAHVVLRQQGRLPARGARREDSLRAQPDAPARGIRSPSRKRGPHVNIDDVVLNFTPGTLVILNVVLGLIMFGIALDTSPEDFRVVARKPKPFVIAILAQLVDPARGHVRADAHPAGDPVDGARHDPGRVLPARQHLAGAHAPLRRQRRTVGLDDRGVEPDLHRGAAALGRVLGVAAPDRPHPA